jgi:hypothetical protein
MSVLVDVWTGVDPGSTPTAGFFRTIGFVLVSQNKYLVVGLQDMGTGNIDSNIWARVIHFPTSAEVATFGPISRLPDPGGRANINYGYRWFPTSDPTMLSGWYGSNKAKLILSGNWSINPSVGTGSLQRVTTWKLTVFGLNVSAEVDEDFKFGGIIPITPDPNKSMDSYDSGSVAATGPGQYVRAYRSYIVNHIQFVNNWSVGTAFVRLADAANFPGADQPEPLLMKTFARSIFGYITTTGGDLTFKLHHAGLGPLWSQAVLPIAPIYSQFDWSHFYTGSGEPLYNEGEVWVKDQKNPTPTYNFSAYRFLWFGGGLSFVRDQDISQTLSSELSGNIPSMVLFKASGIRYAANMRHDVAAANVIDYSGNIDVVSLPWWNPPLFSSGGTKFMLPMQGPHIGKVFIVSDWAGFGGNAFMRTAILKGGVPTPEPSEIPPLRQLQRDDSFVAPRVREVMNQPSSYQESIRGGNTNSYL